MQEEEQKELFKKLGELRREVTALRTELNQADEQKEEWFEKKEELGSRIRGLIRKIKEDREKRNTLTKEVKEEKKERDSLNQEVKDKISAVKELSREKDEISKKAGFKEDPSDIRRQIERLEFKIETEGLSFEKEKKLMDVIKGLKKRYKEAQKISGVWGRIHETSGQIDEKKKQAEEVHKEIQKKAEESQKMHEEMIALSKEVDELKKQEEEAFKKFVEFKAKFNDVNEKLKVKLTELNEVNGKLNKHVKSKRLEKEAREYEILESKEQLIEEKIKKGEKLTTEDLLVFQKFEGMEKE